MQRLCNYFWEDVYHRHMVAQSNREKERKEKVNYYWNTKGGECRIEPTHQSMPRKSTVRSGLNNCGRLNIKLHTHTHTEHKTKQKHTHTHCMQILEYISYKRL